MEDPDRGHLGDPSSDEKSWGMFCHLAAFSGAIGIPFGNVLGPLIVWLIRRDQSDYVDDQGKESLNFQITLSLALMACGGALFISVLTVVLLPVGVILFAAVSLGGLVLTIVGTVKASQGEWFRYPMTIRLIQ